MSQSFFDEELHKVLKSTTVAIQDYMQPYQDNKDYFQRLKFILFGVISSVIEITAVQHDYNIAYMWSEIENMAKEGGLSFVSEKIKEKRTYSVSEIEPEDVGSGMNYLGQKMATMLFKHIHDLPLEQRKPEMLLRAVEALLGNLLKQQFAEFDPHKILDDLCEHVHMAIDDKRSEEEFEKPSVTHLKTTKSSIKPITPSQTKNPTEIETIVININQRVNSILASGGHGLLIQSLPKFMEELDLIMHYDNKDEIDELCEKYDGFFKLMDVIENLAEALNTGKIKL